MSAGFGDVIYACGCEMSRGVNRSNSTTFRLLFLILHLFYDVCSLNIRNYYAKKYRHRLSMSVSSTFLLNSTPSHRQFAENLLPKIRLIPLLRYYNYGLKEGLCHGNFSLRNMINRHVVKSGDHGGYYTNGIYFVSQT
jgi:hypothetical protein